ncbi:MAG: SEC-C domain-containing protein [Euryarchaeota archaeon]|nr:SEC-C domain-containing protein [Euryarchaeota archaeon]
MDMKAGRNEPCPCGSGKKYKKCCMQTQEIKENAERSLREKILEFSREPLFKPDFEEAKEIFMEEKEPDEGGSVMFLDWFIHDFRLKDHGKTIIELFYLEKHQNIAPMEKEILEGWQNTALRVYEVTGIERGRGIRAKDLFDNNELFVNDIRSSKKMTKWDIGAMRVIKTLGKFYLSGAVCLLPATSKDDMIRFGKESFLGFKKEKPGATWQEFFKERGHTFIKFAYLKAAQTPKIVTPEGDPILFAKAIYKVKDYDKALNALYEIPDLKHLESNQNEIHFKLVAEIRDHNVSTGGIMFETSLVSDVGDPQCRSMGDLNINNRQLILDCLSEKRLELGKEMLKTLGDSIEFQSESKQYPDLSGRKNKTVKKKTQENEIDEPVREMLRKKYLEDHYRRWVDMPISFLEGMTPREASRTEEGKVKLKELLKVVENAEERRKREGELSYDVSKLRETLGV